MIRKLIILMYAIMLVASVSCSETYNRILIKNGGVPNEVLALIHKAYPYPMEYHDLVYTAPFEFKNDKPIDYSKPVFLQIDNMDYFENMDNGEIILTYNEISGSFDYIFNLPQYKELYSQLNKENPVIPAVIPLETGELISENSDYKEYVYPKEENARIVVYGDDDFFILYADGTEYRKKKNGDFYRNNFDGSWDYKYTASSRSCIYKRNDYEYVIAPDYRSISSPKGSVAVFLENEYTVTCFIPPDSTVQYQKLKTGKSEKADYFRIEKGSFFQYCYYPKNKCITIYYDNKWVTVTKDYNKIVGYYDSNSDSYSRKLHYLPIGVTLKNIGSAEHSYGEFSPKLPVTYLSKKIGPFNVFYTQQDEEYVKKLNAVKLTEVELFCRTITGLHAPSGRTIILPSGLETYRKLHAPAGGELMNWYPTAFENNDLIVLWPPSVSLYATKEGQEFYFNTEIYEIIAHEYVHLLIEEAAGCVYPVPHWLHEGLAVYVETRLSEKSRSYYDAFADALVKNSCFLEWDRMVSQGASSFQFGYSRIFYGQSYAMVKYLIETYGMVNVVKYAKTFKPPQGNYYKDPLVGIYKIKFGEIFGKTWERNVTDSGLSEK